MAGILKLTVVEPSREALRASIARSWSTGRPFPVVVRSDDRFRPIPRLELELDYRVIRRREDGTHVVEAFDADYALVRLVLPPAGAAAEIPAYVEVTVG